MQTQGTIIGRRTAGARARRGLATITKRVPADGWPIVTVTIAPGLRIKENMKTRIQENMKTRIQEYKKTRKQENKKTRH